MRKGIRLTSEFFNRDVLKVAPGLIGKVLVLKNGEGLNYFSITETEAYRGESDKACHASRGRTPRNNIMYGKAGKVYVYFIYGMYWMLNFVTAEENNPQAVLIRGIEGYCGPGKLTKALNIDGSFYGEDLSTSDRIWIEDQGNKPVVKRGKRVGIGYAGKIWIDKQWRYFSELK